MLEKQTSNDTKANLESYIDIIYLRNSESTIRGLMSIIVHRFFGSFLLINVQQTTENVDEMVSF